MCVFVIFFVALLLFPNIQFSPHHRKKYFITVKFGIWYSSHAEFALKLMFKSYECHLGTVAHSLKLHRFDIYFCIISKMWGLGLALGLCCTGNRISSHHIDIDYFGQWEREWLQSPSLPLHPGRVLLFV